MNNNIFPFLKVKIQQFDCLDYYRDELKGSFNFIIPLIIEIAFMFTLLINIGNIVNEKQTKMKVTLNNCFVLNNRFFMF
jgi:hypothetical protein